MTSSWGMCVVEGWGPWLLGSLSICRPPVARAWAAPLRPGSPAAGMAHTDGIRHRLPGQPRQRGPGRAASCPVSGSSCPRARPGWFVGDAGKAPAEANGPGGAALTSGGVLDWKEGVRVGGQRREGEGQTEEERKLEQGASANGSERLL